MHYSVGSMPFFLKNKKSVSILVLDRNGWIGMFIRLSHRKCSIMVMLKFIQNPYKKWETLIPFQWEAEWIEEWLRNSLFLQIGWREVVELINGRAPFLRPPLGVPEENDLFLLYHCSPGSWRVVSYIHSCCATDHPKQNWHQFIWMIRRNHHWLCNKNFSNDRWR